MKFLSIGRKDRARQVFPKKYCLEMPNIRQKTKPTDRSCVNPRLTSLPPREKKRYTNNLLKLKTRKKSRKKTLNPPLQTHPQEKVPTPTTLTPNPTKVLSPRSVKPITSNNKANGCISNTKKQSTKQQQSWDVSQWNVFAMKHTVKTQNHKNTVSACL